MRPRIHFFTYKNQAHVGFPNGIHLRWGFISCPLELRYRYSISFSIKIRNVEYRIGFNINKPNDKAVVERERNEFDYE